MKCETRPSHGSVWHRLCWDEQVGFDFLSQAQTGIGKVNLAMGAGNGLSAQASPLGNERYLLVWEDCRPNPPDCVDGTSIAAIG
jgi:hypothetical protein